MIASAAAPAGFPLLTLIVLLPMVIAVVVALLPQHAVLTSSSSSASCSPSAPALLTVVAAGQLRDRRRRLPVRHPAHLDPRLRHLVEARRRRHLAVARRAHRDPVPDRLSRPDGRRRTSRPTSAGCCCSRPGAWHVPGPRPLPVLRVLRDRARADVLPHRRLGLRQPRLRRAEVLPLHAGRLGVHARRHAGRWCSCTSARPASLTFDLVDPGRTPGVAPSRRPAGCSSPSPSPSPSRCRCSRCTRGCPTPTPRRPPPAR